MKRASAFRTPGKTPSFGEFGLVAVETRVEGFDSDVEKEVLGDLALGRVNVDYGKDAMSGRTAPGKTHDQSQGRARSGAHSSGGP